MKVATSAQMKEIERVAINQIGIPSILLMENAAAQVVKQCMTYLKDFTNQKVMVICGYGNNGGDGLAIARGLFLQGVDVGVIYVGDPETAEGDVLINLKIAQNIGIPIEPIPMGDNLLDIPYSLETCQLVVDAVLGIGVQRDLEGIFEYIVEMINNYAKYVISVDMPTGVHADSGKVMGMAVQANMTVTFGLPKIGLYLYPGTDYVGEIIVADIGIPSLAVNEVDIEAVILDDAEARSLLPRRIPRSNKGTYGKTFVMAGCDEMPGAAALVSSAVYKAGGGMVKACVCQKVADIIHSKSTETVTRILPDKNGYLYRKSFDMIRDELSQADVIAMGPGLGANEQVEDFVADVILNAASTIVLDADALNVITYNVDILKQLNAPGVITPHPGEMSRLTGLPVPEILDNIIEVAVEFAKKYEVVTVLKDARTIVASPTGHVYINVSGNASMAKAGSGDVLTGLIAAFVAQGEDTFTSCMLASYIHGRAGDMAEKQLSSYGVTATDLIACIPKVLSELQKDKILGF